MVKIFISYSRVDTPFLEKLHPYLGRKYGYESVWYDDRLHGGDDWWETILDHVAWADVFIYLLSNESVTSEYCQAEFQEAHRLNKFIITIQVRDRTKLDDRLSAIQYINMSEGLDVDSITRLFTSIDHANVETIRKKRARSKGRTPKPGTVTELQAVTRSDVDTPILTVTHSNDALQSRRQGFLNEPVAIIIAAIITGLFALLAAWIALNGNNLPTTTPEPTTAVALAETTEPSVPTETPINPVDATITEIYRQVTEANVATRESLAPTETHIAEIVAMTDTVVTQYVIATQVAERLATQITWTPTVTNTPNAPTLAQQGVSSNAEWTPYIQEFNGVEMALVPTGCFDMGSNDGGSDEQPVHETCFDEPFWIDRTEVTQEQFRRFYGVAERSPAFIGDKRPVENITWFEARDFCELRDARLPTEAEWEYVARGVDELVYPWGNEWNENNAVWNRGSSGTANVGSIPAGVSWVGAMDMSGNVWEWVSSLYRGYPYTNAHEGTTSGTDVRVLRGGSYYGFIRNFLRTTFRNWYNPNVESYDFGIRCARDYD